MTEADKIAAETEQMLAALSEERATYFSVAELMWLTHFSAKLRFGTSIETERAYQEAIKRIAACVEDRKRAAAEEGKPE